MTERRTPLYDDHEAAGSSFTPFNGWSMPVEFDTITVEHESVREAVGAFDVSHMGQVEVAGPDAAALCQRLTTNDVNDLEPGDAQYSMITDEDGVILDDTVVYRLPSAGDGDAAGPDDAAPAPGGVEPAIGRDADYLFVPNAGNDEAMTRRWVDHRDEWGLEATVSNRTTEYAMIAVQGPDAEPALVDAIGPAGGRAGAVAAAITELSPFTATHAPIAGESCLVARTGYTGEDGFEVLCPAGAASAVWSAVEAQPCGLGARDTLRLEMGFLLSGQDFHPAENPRNPYEADVAFTVDLDTDFVGRDALAAVAESGPDEVIVGLTLTERGIPRHGYEITDGEGTVVGEVTSGTMSPTLGEPIGLGYVPAGLAEPGTEIAVVVRGDPKTATIVEPPFVGGT